MITKPSKELVRGGGMEKEWGRKEGMGKGKQSESYQEIFGENSS
jgi:hypothetical protein